MGFTKASNEPEVRIEVHHNWHPGAVFAFTFPKRLPPAATLAESRFLALKEDARPDEHRLALIETVAQMVVREPEGFDDFPGSSQAVSSLRDVPLLERFVTYFDDPEQPELEQVIIAAWRAYRATSVPSAYMKSVSDRSARNGDAL